MAGDYFWFKAGESAEPERAWAMNDGKYDLRFFKLKGDTMRLNKERCLVGEDGITLRDHAGLKKIFGDKGGSEETAIIVMGEPVSGLSQPHVPAEFGSASEVLDKIASEGQVPPDLPTKAAYVQLAFNSIDSPRKEAAMHCLVVDMVKRYMRSYQFRGGLSGKDQREAMLPSDMIPNLGHCFPMVDREDACIGFLKACEAIQARVHLNACDYDQRKEGKSFIALVSVPGGGKTSISRMFPTMVTRLQGIEENRARVFSICDKENLQFRYDFTFPGNRFDVQFECGANAPVRADQSLALRVLYMMVHGDSSPISFQQFINNLSHHNEYYALLTTLLVRHVVQAAHSIWKEEPGGIKHEGLMIFTLDEAHAVFESSVEKQDAPHSGANRFRAMLSSWDNELFAAKAPIVLIVAGTRLDIALQSRLLCSASATAQPCLLPLRQVTPDGLLKVAQSLLGRMGQGRAGQGPAGQGRAGQGSAGQGSAGQAADKMSETVLTLVSYSGGNPRMFEVLLAAACQVRKGFSPSNVESTSGADTRWNVETKILREVLTTSLFSPEQLQQACMIAVSMLTQRSNTLLKYVLNDQYFSLGQAIIQAQLLGSVVKHEQVVNDAHYPGVTWGCLETDGLLQLKPVVQADFQASPLTAGCTVVMPYMLYVMWTNCLLERSVLPPLPVHLLTSGWDHNLYWQQKEALDLSVMMSRVFTFVKWVDMPSFTAAQLLQINRNSKALYDKYNEYHLKVPSGAEEFYVEKQHAKIDLSNLISRVKSGQLKTIGFLGLGNTPEPDWFLVLEVDKTRSSGPAQSKSWFIVQGQSKMRKIVGKGTFSAAEINKEACKRYKTAGLDAASIFVLVTDEAFEPGKLDLVPDDERPSILVVGSHEHDSYYGPAGSLKRLHVSKLQEAHAKRTKEA